VGWENWVDWRSCGVSIAQSIKDLLTRNVMICLMENRELVVYDLYVTCALYEPLHIHMSSCPWLALSLLLASRPFASASLRNGIVSS